MKERVARVADDDPPVNVEAHFEKYSLLLTSYGHFTNNFLKTQIVHFVDTICPRGPAWAVAAAAGPPRRESERRDLTAVR